MVSDISVLGRVTSGVKLINLDDKNVYVASVAKVREDSKTTSDEEVIKNLEKELQEDAVVSDDEEFEEDFDEEDLEEEDFDEDDSDGNDYETDEPDDI